MINPWISTALLAAALVAGPATLSAQQTQWPPPPQAAPKTKQAPRAQQPAPQRELDVEELTPGQIQRAQEPPKQSAPKGEARPAIPKAASPAARAVACSGIFAKDSSHLKLATMFDSRNVIFTEIDGPDGIKLNASVLFPRDPKRRLEVLWENEAARMGTSLIVINGQSTWTAPKGLRLGLQLAALERLNGKPFKLKGFDKDDVGAVSDWQGGALASLPGGCKVGIYLKPDPKTPPEARSELSSDKEFTSSDAAIKSARPTIAEILLGY